MIKYKLKLKDFFFSVVVLALTFLLSFLIQFILKTDTLVPTIFVLGVFFVSLKTEGYIWGVIASLVGVMLVNFAFTMPYFEIDLITPVNMFAAVVMLVIAIMTSALTTQVKQQEWELQHLSL